jgi:hypothetical protein
MNLSLRILCLVLLTLAMAPDSAEACTVCGAAADNKNAFIGMTAFLTLTPLAFMGGVIYWLKTRAAALDLLELE